MGVRHRLEQILPEERILCEALDGLDQVRLEREALALRQARLRVEEVGEAIHVLSAVGQGRERPLIVAAVE